MVIWIIFLFLHIFSKIYAKSFLDIWNIFAAFI